MQVAEVALAARGEIPLREVSGLAVAHGPGGVQVLAVGDRGPDVAVAPLGDDGLPAVWTTVDLRTLDGAPSGAGRQAEAIAVDGAGQVVVLVEDPAAVGVVDLAAGRWVAAVRLGAGAVPGLAEVWDDDASSRGEGLVLLRDGHLLVAKEKRPAGLLELAPAGAAARGFAPDRLLAPGEAWTAPSAALQAVAWWPLADGLDDVSDLAVGPDGRLHLLSDQSRAVGRLAGGGLAPDDPGCAIDALWRLPKKVDKAEGLAFLPDGRVLVAVDRPDAGRNLAVLPPLADA